MSNYNPYPMPHHNLDPFKESYYTLVGHVRHLFTIIYDYDTGHHHIIAKTLNINQTDYPKIGLRCYLPENREAIFFQAGDIEMILFHPKASKDIQNHLNSKSRKEP